MDFINDKLTSFAGPAISGINEMKRKREKEKNASKLKESSAKAMQNEEQPASSSSTNKHDIKLSRGILFGGDSLSATNQVLPPPIGFRTDLIVDSEPKRDQNLSAENEEEEKKRPISGGSDASLYQGDTWSRLWFQRVMLLSLIRLLLFVRKVYEDFHATKAYNASGHVGHFLIAAATLFLPTIIFTLYRVARYLQIVLPSSRTITPESNAKSAHPKQQSSSRQEGSANDEELRRALMSSPTIASQQDEDGLVTARQTPTNLNEDFHDSKSQQEEPTVSAAEEINTVEELVKETVEVEKLGDLPDKQSVRVALGASEQLLHGVLFIFWQLKRQVDVLGYLVERSCLWRKPSEREKEELARLRTGSDGLEWFQDFYAAFLAILAQVYTLGLHWTSDKRANWNLAVPASGALDSLASSDLSELGISAAAKALSQQALSNVALAGKDLLIMSELLVSSLVIFSLLIAVKRRDDGPLTLALSMLGWGSIFASRIIIIALSFVHIGYQIMLPLIGCHVVGITCWIYKIALDSHNGKKSEQGDEMRWNPDLGSNTIELKADERKPEEIPSNSVSESKATDEWSALEHFTLLSQIFTLFAIPSLFYWPIMFNLKSNLRPFKYLVLIMTQNFLLIPAIWFTVAHIATPGQWYLLGAAGGFSILGFVFVTLYISCKPSLTEYFARADQLFNEAEKAGIYFEFCSRVFKMPDLNVHAFRRLMKQTEEQIETELE